MNEQMLVRFAPWLVGVVVIIVAVLARSLVMRLFGVVMIPQNTIGIVNKKYVIAGKNKALPDGSVIALNGEAGWQADPLAPGVYFGMWPWQYDIKMQPFMVVPPNQIAIVEAKDGHPLSGGRVLAKHVECDSFQNARAFLTGGGERGMQISIVPPGTYRVNTELFEVRFSGQAEVPDNKVGIVTTKEGASLPAGEIAGSTIAGHNSFQDAQAFVTKGGFKGLQEQVILAGRYFLNPLFASVELQDMTTVPIANVGVVISYVGAFGKDVTGESFKHGNLVSKGERGVWVEPLDPGRYPINPFTHKVEIVPTANVVLNWATGKSEAHKLDANLSTITVRSSDGFTFNLDVSQIIHIPRSEAPKVIARFGNMPNLVTQVLEPTIGNYFRNAAQGSDVIDFLKQRQQRQADAKDKIGHALDEYNVNAVDTLIGDITPPEALMKTLTDRKIADQQKVTFQTQQQAETERQKLQQAKALADTQPQVVTAERSVQIAEYTASATVKTADGSKRAAILAAEGEAAARTLEGNATAAVTTAVGAADASKTLAIGKAEADVIEMKIKSMNTDNYAGVEIARALASSGKALVPEIIAGGMNGEAGGGSIVSVLLAGLIRDRRNGELTDRRNG